MASARRKQKPRRDSVSNARAELLNLRLGPNDRTAPEHQINEPSPASLRDEPRPGAIALRARGHGEVRLSKGASRRRRGGNGGGSQHWRLGRLLYWLMVIALWALIAAAGMVVWVGAHLPPIQSLEVPRRPPAIEIVGLGGHVLATRGEMGAAVPLRELPAYVPQAFIAIEDHRFYTHHGVDPLGIVRAAFANLVHRAVAQGGSTLTQQLAKNLFLTPERTYQRKLEEVVLALWLERKFSKAQLLELYLNRVYFGSGAYGIEAAAQRYFGKSARQVTLAEAALLAGLVRSPSRLAPTRNPDGAERRAQTVLVAMAANGFITDRLAEAAISHAPRILKQVPGGSGNYVADWVMDVLNDLIGRVEQDIVVETTIDPVLETAAERALTEELAQKGDRFGVGQGAIVAVTPDGAVRALVGGRNYTESQYNRAIAAKRQPGSAFKPFVYLTALERGLTPDTLREDRPIDVKGWRPENYGHQYLGPVSLTRALSLSLNTVSVRLTLEVGPQAVVRTAHRLGIASKLDPNASIALGTSEVSVLELVAAYAPFANGGVAIVPRVVDRVRTLSGQTLYTAAQTSLGRVIEDRYVAMMNAMMQETLLTGTARRAELAGWQAAGKTGTSQDFRDAWFIGYTSHLLGAVWLGNDDNAPTRKITGGGLPVEIWSRFMKVAHQGVVASNLPGLTVERPGPVAGPQPPALLDGDRPPAPSSGLDTWLLDRLFGRR
jgi:penicillin-binding protein 1A